MSSTLITDYMQRGLLSARPSTPDVAAGVSSLYYATDTLQTFMWNGTSWDRIAGPAGSGPAVVQCAVNVYNGTGLNTVTLPVPPTAGNLLVAICPSSTSETPNTGWTLWYSLANFGRIFVKTAGPGESATQQPISNGTGIRDLLIYELENVTNIGFLGPDIYKVLNNATAQTITLYPTGTNMIFFGFVRNANTNTPTGGYTSNITLGPGAVGTASSFNRHMQLMYVEATDVTAALNTMTATYGVSTSCVLCFLAGFG